MKAIRFEQPGEPDVLRLVDVPDLKPGPGEVLVAVCAAGVNRADLMQRRGLYPPPAGASDILGLEAAGHIAALGPGAPGSAASAPFSVGQSVMALLSGGGYAEQVVVPVGQVMAVPTSVSALHAGAIPEAFLTAYLNLFHLGGLPFAPEAGEGAGRSVLIHGGASGVGTAALQLCRAAGVTAYCTVGDDDRGARCVALGARAALNYRSTDWAEKLQSATDGRGVDVVLDCIGGSYLDRNLRSLAIDGRLVIIGLQGGTHANLDLAVVLRRRIQVIGSTLRPLSTARKAALCSDFAARALPLFDRGLLAPIVDCVMPLSEAAAAHRAMDGAHFGKIILQVGAAG